MASPAAVLSILVSANTQQATAALARTDAQLKSTTASANTASSAMGTKLKSAAKTGAVALGVTFAYGAYKAIDVGVKFEKQMDSLGSVANATEKDMKRLEKQALSLGQKTAFSASEAADAQIELAKGGLKVKQILGGALPAALSLAAAGELDLGDAARTTVNAMKLFELKAKDASHVADMLATAANKTTADVSDFAMALQQGGSAAKQAGLDLNQTMLVLEALAESGIKNSDAGTSMKTAILQLLAPTAKQADLAKQLNLEFVNQAGEMKSVASISAMLQDSLGKYGDAQRAAYLKTLAGTDGFRTLAALYDAGPEKLDKLSKANQQWGSAQEIAREKMDNTAGSLDQLQGAFETLGIKVFKVVGPSFRDAVDAMTQAVIYLTNIGRNKDFKQLVDALGNIADVMRKYVLPIVRSVAEKFGIVMETMAKVAFHAVNTISALLTGKWVNAWQSAKDTVTSIFGGIIKLLANMAEPFRGAIEAIAVLIKVPLVGAWHLVTKVFRKSADVILGVFTTILDGMAETADVASNLPGPLGDAFDKIQSSVEGARDRVNHFRETMRDTGKVVSKDSLFSGLWNNLDHTGDSMGRLSDKAAQMRDSVSGSVFSLANAVAKGLGNIGENTKSVANSLGIKDKLSFTIKQVGETVGNVAKHQTGGVIVPGQGDGDKVPALLEPGEVVWNKKLVAAMGGAQKVNAANSLIPRFATGGVIEQALGPYTMGPIQYDPNHAGGNSHLHLDFFTQAQAIAYGKKMQGMGWTIGEYSGPYGGFGGITTQHQSPGHYDGTAFDANTAADETRSEVAKVVQLLGGKGVAGAVAEKIARTLLKGPDGPLKSIGQGALDKVRAAANKFIMAKAPNGEMGPGSPMKGLPKALQKYNQVYPASSGFGDGYAMPFNAVAALAEWAGAPGISMARTAIGESQLEPGAVGHDPGGTTGLGLWMITTGFNDALIANLGGVSSMRNPVLNAQAMNSIFDSQGIGAWYSQTKDTSNTHYDGPLLRRLGGIIPHLAGGGSVLTGGSGYKQGKKGRATLSDLMEKIKRDTDRIGKLTERITISESFAGLESGPAGSDLSSGERTGLTKLNLNLLSRLTEQRDYVKGALKLGGHKIDRITGRLGGDDGAISRHRDRIKELRGEMAGGGGKKIADLREQLKHTKNEHNRQQIQKQITAIQENRDKANEKIQHQIDAEQKKLDELRAKRQDRRGRLGGKLSNANERVSALQTMLVDLQGVTGKGGSILETSFALQDLLAGRKASTSAVGPNFEAINALLTEQNLGLNRSLALQRAQFPVFNSLPKFDKGGMVPGPVGSPQPILAHGGEQVLTPAQQTGDTYLYADIYIGGEKVDERVEVKLRDVERRRQRRTPTVI